jgi:LmbE family N-acetylglucosaminyl deacetylase
MGAGEFFGELALTSNQPRSAHVIAATTVTCLVFSRSAPTAYDGRGAGAQAWRAGTNDGRVPDPPPTTCIDVSAFVEHKVAAIAAHRTQFPIEPRVFPPAMLHEMLHREYFVRVSPPRALETTLLTTCPMPTD